MMDRKILILVGMEVSAMLHSYLSPMNVQLCSCAHRYVAR
jgi:hypothetical protein